MERQREFRGRGTGSFSHGRWNNDFRKPRYNQFNPARSQNNSQFVQNQRNPDEFNFDNANQGNWNQNTNQSWHRQRFNNDQGYWKQVSTSNDNQNLRQFGNLKRGRSTPYDRPRRGRGTRFVNNRRDVQTSREREPSPDIPPNPVPLTPLEAKIERLISAVQSQPDNLGQLILLQNNNEIPPVLLNNATHQVKNCTLNIDRNESNGYSKLRINNTIIAEGMYSTKKDAKEALYEMGLDVMRNKCFYIASKSHYEEVSMNDLNNQPKPDESEPVMDPNSKAMQMMLKMGWGGKGLGTLEQGERQSVADKIVENISREGLGGSGQTVMQEVEKILVDYAKSSKTTTLGFDSGFTKEERAQIHQIAAKYHLKSKSEGGFNSRRITISKKMSKWVLVRELLSVGLENESYILTIPDDFKHLWSEDE
ncbi:unnamed protein product [Phyllotreta striolata]|uniref:NF-kappa-B-repressing factor n=1 Tax=Phyllotreta striolata TaxID=444603 RepID=A0A9N9THB4_PHYSR|nr:unnamed protein product [Phyllotreta striolata]